jgi:hypothetical protein
VVRLGDTFREGILLAKSTRFDPARETEHARTRLLLSHKLQSSFLTKECRVESLVKYGKCILLTHEKGKALDGRIAAGDWIIDPRLRFLRSEELTELLGKAFASFTSHRLITRANRPI